MGRIDERGKIERESLRETERDGGGGERVGREGGRDREKKKKKEREPRGGGREREEGREAGRGDKIYLFNAIHPCCNAAK